MVYSISHPKLSVKEIHDEQKQRLVPAIRPQIRTRSILGDDPGGNRKFLVVGQPGSSTRAGGDRTPGAGNFMGDCFDIHPASKPIIHPVGVGLKFMPTLLF